MPHPEQHLEILKGNNTLTRIMKLNRFLCCWILLFFSSNLLRAQVLHPVEAGSSVTFEIRNFGFTTRGSFGGLTGAIRFDPQHPEQADFEVSIAAASINTGNRTRDRHLRSDDYFDVDRFPRISVKSESIRTIKSGSSYILLGALTIKGITRKISIPFTVATADGALVFDGSFSVKRQDFQVGGDSISMADSATIHLHIIAR
jgi:polyisoprenoid-binding protein YceI